MIDCVMVPDGTDTNGDVWNRCTTHDQLVLGDAYVCEGYTPPPYVEHTYSVEVRVCGDDGSDDAVWVLDNVHDRDEAEAIAIDATTSHYIRTGIMPERLEDSAP